MLVETLIAQDVRIVDAKIVDESNGQNLPYATVYIAPNQGTISNQEGEFSISVLSTDNLKISYVGYESVLIPANDVPAVIKLRPYSILLSEVIVKPVNLHKLVQQIFEQQKKQIEKYKNYESAFFYRQITQMNSECNEIMETFLNSKSVICLRDLNIVAGRYAKLENDSVHEYLSFEDFFRYSQLTPIRVKRLKKKETIVPLMSDFSKYYTLSYDVLLSGQNYIYKIIFTPKKIGKRFIIGGTLYVDSSTLDIIRIESMIMMPVVMWHNGKMIGHRLADLKIALNYKLMEHVSVVETVNVHCEIKTETDFYKFNSILYNMGDKIENKKSKSPKSNMLKAVEKMNYDPAFWKDKAIIKRTPLEQSAIEMFERKNLFGTYSLDK
ncbi:carboxypeptidase-like regulatory domain-containing protein [Bacteroides heparinolyticus]|uniref:carboxypeptidase-like regulatory domain-containing protein n=12 Tax=Prevotella heparinolytica TaxID=28113 RepID=UPI0023F4A300|nr:carboxypeptidase-like regulatory domain-containing protein [Bacteroides heparinolyticus]MCI6212564.1 carboxypeptidase-like regulatory domain-containing protein [Bacteroides heparinolyticus]